jgi:hypothetical protein
VVRPPRPYILITGSKRETCVAGDIEALDPEIKVICLLVTDVQDTRRPSGESTEFSGKRDETCVFDIAESRA